MAVVGTGGVSDDSGFAAIAAQLNDSTAFDFDRQRGPGRSAVDTGGELDVFDVVVIGSTGLDSVTGDPFGNAAFTSALRTWVEAGGGVVMSGPGVWGAGIGNGSDTPVADINVIIPVDTASPSIPNNAATVDINGTAHPVTNGVSDFTLSNGDPVEVPAGGADGGGTVLATTNGGPSVVVGTVASGRGVFLGPIYSGTAGFFNNAELRSNNPDRLLEQAVNWAANTSGGGTNQAPTDISLSASTIPENQSAGTAIGTLSATDPNAGDTHTFALVSGAGSTDNTAFTINGNTLQSNSIFNFEVKSVFSIRVRATDQGALFFEKVFNITVTNVNEAPTDIQLSPTSVPGEPAGQHPGRHALVLGSSHSGNTFTYSLVSGTAARGTPPSTSMARLCGPVPCSILRLKRTTASACRTDRSQRPVFRKGLYDHHPRPELEPTNTPPTLSGVPVSTNVDEGQLVVVHGHGH